MCAAHPAAAVVLAAILLLRLAGGRILAVFGQVWRAWARSLFAGRLLFSEAGCIADGLAGQSARS